jgi:hypothetical protein
VCRERGDDARRPTGKVRKSAATTDACKRAQLVLLD